MVQYNWICTASLPANLALYSEVDADCVEDPGRGSEKVIQRVYPIFINTIVIPDTVTVDYVVRVYKEDVSGIRRPVVDSLNAKTIRALMSVSGQVPRAFYSRGQPASIYVAPMERVSLRVMNIETPSAATTVRFLVVADKGV